MYLIKPTISQDGGSSIELVDNLNQTESGKALDARQGNLLKEMIPSIPDLTGYAKITDIPTMPDLSNYAKKTDIPVIPSLTYNSSHVEIRESPIYRDGTDLKGHGTITGSILYNDTALTTNAYYVMELELYCNFNGYIFVNDDQPTKIICSPAYVMAVNGGIAKLNIKFFTYSTISAKSPLFRLFALNT